MISFSRQSLKLSAMDSHIISHLNVVSNGATQVVGFIFQEATASNKINGHSFD